MYRTIAVAAVYVLTASTHAQVYRCQNGDGKTTYSDQPCAAAGGAVDPTLLNGNSAGVVRAPARPAAPPGPMPAAAQARKCPDETSIRNLETDASSILLDQYDKQVKAEQVRRARGCQPLMTAAEEFQMREELKASARARRPAPPPANTGPSVITSCDTHGCWGSDGSRYNSAGGSSFTRSDGAQCQRSRDMLYCN